MRSFGNTHDTFQKNILYATCVISDNPFNTMYSQSCHCKSNIYIIKENMKVRQIIYSWFQKKVTIEHGILSLPDRLDVLPGNWASHLSFVWGRQSNHL